MSALLEFRQGLKDTGFVEGQNVEHGEFLRASWRRRGGKVKPPTS